MKVLSPAFDKPRLLLQVALLEDLLEVLVDIYRFHCVVIINKTSRTT